MKIQTLSLLAGTLACNARCPFCVAGTTPQNTISNKPTLINVRNLKKCIQLAERCDATTAIITGKGEPTLFPENIATYLQYLRYRIPILELQTNGIAISNGKISDSCLESWYDFGLNTIMLSMVGIDYQLGKQIYTPYLGHYMNIKLLLEKLQKLFTVRMCIVAIKGGVDSPVKLDDIVKFAKENGVAQITIRPAARPNNGQNTINQWIDDNTVDSVAWKEIVDYVQKEAYVLMELPHGSAIYELDGQNICLSNCLTHKADPEDQRQLIFYPDGRIMYDWVHQGAILV